MWMFKIDRCAPLELSVLLRNLSPRSINLLSDVLRMSIFLCNKFSLAETFKRESLSRSLPSNHRDVKSINRERRGKKKKPHGTLKINRKSVLFLHWEYIKSTLSKCRVKEKQLQWAADKGSPGSPTSICALLGLPSSSGHGTQVQVSTRKKKKQGVQAWKSWVLSLTSELLGCFLTLLSSRGAVAILWTLKLPI